MVNEIHELSDKEVKNNQPYTLKCQFVNGKQNGPTF